MRVCVAKDGSLSIPLWCDCNQLKPVSETPSISAFNPTMVRLQPQVNPNGMMTGKLSIPLWCDCNPFYLKEDE